MHRKNDAAKITNRREEDCCDEYRGLYVGTGRDLSLRVPGISQTPQTLFPYLKFNNFLSEYKILILDFKQINTRRKCRQIERKISRIEFFLSYNRPSVI